jgi:hypothetical protein
MNHSRTTLSAAVSLALCSLATTYPLIGSAAWEIVPRIGIITEVDDNARMQPVDQPSSSRTSLDARVRLRNFGARGEAYIEPRIVAESYANSRDRELENDDVFLTTRAAYNFTNTRIELLTDYRRESILRSELANPIIEDPLLGPELIDIGAGTLGTFTDRRERFDVGFNAQFTLSTRTNLRIETSYMDVNYLENQSADRSDFDNTTVAAVLTRLVDQRNRVSARFYVSDFNADQRNNETDAFGVEGLLTRPLTETWTFQLNAGVARTDFRLDDPLFGTLDDAESSFTYGITFDRRSQTTRWTIGAGRAIAPNPSGFLSQRDDVRLQWRRQLRPRLAASAGLRASQVAGVAELANITERDYVRASLEFEWAMRPRWLVTSGLDHASQETARFGGRDATSNAVYVGVRYEGLSRGGGR